jgi:hypothetical protein
MTDLDPKALDAACNKMWPLSDLSSEDAREQLRGDMRNAIETYNAFDGPISGVSCDVCEAQRLEWMIPKRHLHVVRAERDRYRDALQRIIDPGDVRAQLWPRLVAKEALGEAV